MSTHTTRSQCAKSTGVSAVNLGLDGIREATMISEDSIYFQTGGHSPKLAPVIEEAIYWLRLQGPGPAKPEIADKLSEMFDEVRGRVARAVNASPDEIMLNENTTTGINVVANGIDWRAGDSVVLSTHEHPGNRLPWYNLKQRYGIELRFLDASADDSELLDDLEEALDDRTRVVSISHVSRESGRRFPARHIVDLAHRQEVPVLFDGAQAFGAIPVDVRALNCDFYTFSGHKYIMAPQGTGGFYVRHDRLDWLKPSWIGSHSQREMDLEGHMTLHDAAKRFEFGTRNLADQAGFGKALELWESVGWDRVYDAIASYTDAMKTALQSIPGLVVETPLPYEKSSSIVTFRVPGVDGRRLVEWLRDQERILVSPVGSDGQSIRVSTHVFNTDADLQRLVGALELFLAT